MLNRLSCAVQYILFRINEFVKCRKQSAIFVIAYYCVHNYQIITMLVHRNITLFQATTIPTGVISHSNLSKLIQIIFTIGPYVWVFSHILLKAYTMMGTVNTSKFKCYIIWLKWNDFQFIKRSIHFILLVCRNMTK